MKKRPDPSLIKNELESGSAFFSEGRRRNSDITVEPSSPLQPESAAEAPSDNVGQKQPLPNEKSEERQPTEVVTNEMLTADYPPHEVVEMIRKAVKQVGREGQVFRLSLEEKRTLSDIVYSYKRVGVRTSENEVCRIAIVYLLHDYKAKGEGSILSRVIDALIS